MRKIVFLGNCQARVYHNLYVDQIAPHLGDEVSFVASFGVPDDEIRSRIANADVVVAQLYDGDANIGLHSIETGADVVLFPNITGMFLWPLGGQPHPSNKSEAYLPHGPFDINAGDRWLDRKLRGRSLDIAEAGRIADEYIALDLATVAKADRVYELIIDRQRQRDAKSGFACADVIERYLQNEVVFPTASTCTLPLFRHVVGCLFRRLGAPNHIVALMLERMVRTPTPPFARPIHPSIAKFFNLRYITPDTRYLFCTGEFVTLREYVVRYLRYDWNESLLKSCVEAENVPRDVDRTGIEARIQSLTAELRRSTGSGRCERALSHLYGLIGEHESAFGAYCHAMVLEPDDPYAVGHYAHLLMEKGRSAEAEQVLRGAVGRWPQLPSLWRRLGVLLVQEGRTHEAAETMQLAVTLHPDDERTCSFQEHVQARLVDIRDAAQ